MSSLRSSRAPRTARSSQRTGSSSQAVCCMRRAVCLRRPHLVHKVADERAMAALVDGAAEDLGGRLNGQVGDLRAQFDECFLLLALNLFLAAAQQLFRL